jgi:hypothetical protein
MSDRPPLTLGRPARPGLPHARRGRPRGHRLGWRCQILNQGARAFGCAAAFGKGRDLENPHRPVERHRHHIAYMHRAAGGIDALAVDPHMTGSRKRRSRSAGAHHPGMPEPLVYALPIQGKALMPLLGVGLELLLERRELGKGRIRIRGLVAAIPGLAAALEVFGAQLRIAIGPIAAAPGPL